MIVISISCILAFHTGSRRLVLILLRICYSKFPKISIVDSKWLDKFEEKLKKSSNKAPQADAGPVDKKPEIDRTEDANLKADAGPPGRKAKTDKTDEKQTKGVTAPTDNVDAASGSSPSSTDGSATSARRRSVKPEGLSATASQNRRISASPTTSDQDGSGLSLRAPVRSARTVMGQAFNKLRGRGEKRTLNESDDYSYSDDGSELSDVIVVPAPIPRPSAASRGKMTRGNDNRSPSSSFDEVERGDYTARGAKFRAIENVGAAFNKLLGRDQKRSSEERQDPEP